MFLPLRFLKFVHCVAEVKSSRPEVELMEDIGGSRSFAGACIKPSKTCDV